MKTLAQMTCKEILALNVIVLTVGGAPAYYAPGQSDGMWYTRDLGEARKYKRVSNASTVIASFGHSDIWATARVECVASL